MLLLSDSCVWHKTDWNITNLFQVCLRRDCFISVLFQRLVHVKQNAETHRMIRLFYLSMETSKANQHGEGRRRRQGLLYEAGIAAAGVNIASSKIITARTRNRRTITMWVRETPFPLAFRVWRYTDRCCRTRGNWHRQTPKFQHKIASSPLNYLKTTAQRRKLIHVRFHGVHRLSSSIYTLSGKKGATLFFAITLPYPNRSSKFFYRHTQQ